MDSFFGKVSSLSDSIGEKSVRALGGVLDGLTSPPSHDRLRVYADGASDEEAAGGSGARRGGRGRGSGDDDDDDDENDGVASMRTPARGSAGLGASLPSVGSGSLGGWLGRLGGAASADDSLDREPLVGRTDSAELQGSDAAAATAAAAAGGRLGGAAGAAAAGSAAVAAGCGFGSGLGLGGLGLGGSLGSSLGALPTVGASSSELLASLRAGLSSRAASATQLAGAAAARAREGGTALASGAAAKAREGSAVLAMAGVPLPASLSAAEPPPDPACALCARYCPCAHLSYSARLAGFGICFLLGLVLSLASLTSLTQLLLGNPRPFATKYTLGNAISIASSMFLMGPTTQCNNMFHPDRRGATLLYLASMVGTFLAVSAVQSGLLALVCVCFQMGALVWYVFSYVPYGRACLRRCFSNAMRFAV